MLFAAVICLTRHLSGPTNVSSIAAAIVFFVFFVRLGSGWLWDLLRQYNLAPCGWKQVPNDITSGGDHIRVGSRSDPVIFARALMGIFPRKLPSTKRRTLLKNVDFFILFNHGSSCFYLVKSILKSTKRSKLLFASASVLFTSPGNNKLIPYAS